MGKKVLVSYFLRCDRDSDQPSRTSGRLQASVLSIQSCFLLLALLLLFHSFGALSIPPASPLACIHYSQSVETVRFCFWWIHTKLIRVTRQMGYINFAFYMFWTVLICRKFLCLHLLLLSPPAERFARIPDTRMFFSTRGVIKWSINKCVIIVFVI